MRAYSPRPASFYSHSIANFNSLRWISSSLSTWRAAQVREAGVFVWVCATQQETEHQNYVFGYKQAEREHKGDLDIVNRDFVFCFCVLHSHYCVTIAIIILLLRSVSSGSFFTSLLRFFFVFLQCCLICHTRQPTTRTIRQPLLRFSLSVFVPLFALIRFRIFLFIFKRSVFGAARMWNLKELRSSRVSGFFPRFA